MKKFIRNTVLFVLVAMLMYMVFLLAWGSVMPEWVKSNLNYKRGSYGHMYTRLQEVKHTSDVDILFLGSSHAYRGFDTRFFRNKGLKVFNLGSSAQTPLQTEVLLKRYLDQLNPKLIIYEVYPGTFTIDGVESSLDIIANDRNDRYSLQMALELNNMKTYNTLIYAVLKERLFPDDSFKEPVKKDGDTYIPGGYVEREMGYYPRYPDLPEQEWEWNDDQFAAYDAVMTMLKKKRIDVIQVYAPVTPGLYRSYTNNGVFGKMMSAYGPYYDFNTIMDLDDIRHFYDHHHMNQKGVEVFNAWLYAIIQREYSF